MGLWLDFVQVALALSVGWVGWVLWHITQTPTAPRSSGQKRAATRHAPLHPAAVISRRAIDGER